MNTCNSKCKYREKCYEETNIRFNLLEDAEKVAKEKNLEIDNRPSGFYLIRYVGDICSIRGSRDFIDDEVECVLSKDCEGQLKFDLDGKVLED